MKISIQAEKLYAQLDVELNLFHEGARFFTVKEIMQRFKANRRVVDAVLQKMSADGLIECVPSVGIFCRTNRQPEDKIILLAICDWPSEINRMWVDEIARKIAENPGYKLRILMYNPYAPLVPQLEKELCDAMILLSIQQTIDTDGIARLSANRRPVVFLDANITALSISSIGSDHYHGGMLAAECLIRNNHRQLLVIQAEPEGYGIRARVNGFRFFAEGIGAKVSELNGRTYSGEIVVEKAHIMLGEYLRANGLNFTGIFVSSDASVPGVLAALQDFGIKIPEQVSIVGYDGLASGNFLRPALTSVGNDLESLVNELFLGLSDVMERRKEYFNVSVPMKIIKRNSVAKMVQSQ